MKSISAADANRNFSSLLRDVSRGEEVTVVSRGTPVARIVGIAAKDGARASAKAALLTRLRAQKPVGARNWTRAELYE
jgi:prevent-host-death family protein